MRTPLALLALAPLAGADLGFAGDTTQTLPLNADAYWLATLLAPNAPPLAGSFGALDAAGTATASFTAPAGTHPAFAGITVDHAFVVIEVLPTLLHVVHTSDAASFVFVP